MNMPLPINKDNFDTICDKLYDTYIGGSMDIYKLLKV